MTVTVYYANYDNVILNDPEPLASTVVDMLAGKTRSLQCPAFKEYFKNTTRYWFKWYKTVRKSNNKYD